MGEPFKIDPIRPLLDQLRFAIACAAADKHYRFLNLFFRNVYRRLAQRFVAAFDQRVLDARLAQPLLSNMRSLAAARAAEIAVRVFFAGRAPGVNSLLAFLAADPLMTQRQRSVRPWRL